jgi:hypothetical protein
MSKTFRIISKSVFYAGLAIKKTTKNHPKKLSKKQGGDRSHWGRGPHCCLE